MPRGDEPSDDGSRPPEVHPIVATIVTWYWRAMKTLPVVLLLILFLNPVYCQLNPEPDPGDVVGYVSARDISTLEEDVDPANGTVVEFSDLTLREARMAVLWAGDPNNSSAWMPYTDTEEDRIHSSTLSEQIKSGEVYVRYSEVLYKIEFQGAHVGQDNAFIVCS